MKHFFITNLKQAVDAWSLAFPELQLYDHADAVAGALTQEHQMFWVHVQAEQGGRWLVEMKRLQSRFPRSKVVVISNIPEQQEAMQALGLGAAGYLHAYAHQLVLKEVCNAVKHGGIWLGKDLLKYLIGTTQQSSRQSQAHLDEVTEVLTKREKEVALEAAKGLSNKEIARVLAISERTVKAHLTSVFERLQVKDRLHLALVLKGQQFDRGMEDVGFFQQKKPNKVRIYS